MDINQISSDKSKSAFVDNMARAQKVLNEATANLVKHMCEDRIYFEPMPPLSLKRRVIGRVRGAIWRVKVAFDILRHGDMSHWLGD